MYMAEEEKKIFDLQSYKLNMESAPGDIVDILHPVVSESGEVVSKAITFRVKGIARNPGSDASTKPYVMTTKTITAGQLFGFGGHELAQDVANGAVNIDMYVTPAHKDTDMQWIAPDSTNGFVGRYVDGKGRTCPGKRINTSPGSEALRYICRDKKLDAEIAGNPKLKTNIDKWYEAQGFSKNVTAQHEFDAVTGARQTEVLNLFDRIADAWNSRPLQTFAMPAEEIVQ
jgi:hypothetical protein